MTVEEEKLLKEAGEQLLNKTKKLWEKEGEEGWKLAQETMLKEKTSNKELKEAMRYIMLKSPPDYFRPALLSFCSKAVGGTSDATIPIASSLVLFARAIGIHDDIIDQSKTKNKHTTVLGKFGRDIALILTDILLFKGFTLLRKTIKLKVPLERVIAVLDVIDEIWFEQSEGGVLDIQARSKTNITTKECLTKIRKIASETEAIARMGGILGGGSKGEIEALGKYGRLLGMASIVRNELIDMLDFKTLLHRIRKESLPLPLVHTLQDSQARSKLTSLISKRRLKTEILGEISKISDDSGGIEYAANLITKIVRKAYSYIYIFKDQEAYVPLKLLITTLPIIPEEWRPLLHGKS